MGQERTRQTIDTALLSPEQQLDAAQDTSDWLVPFLYGVEVEAGPLSLTVQARFNEIVGPKESTQQLSQLREIFASLPPEHRNNAVLYESGYPQDALRVLADGDFEVTTQLLLEVGAIYRPAEETKRRGVVTGGAAVALESTGIRPGSIKNTPAAPVNRSLRLHSRDEDEDDNPLAWQTDALCAQTDPEAFFPEKGGSTRDAKKICTTCEVKAQCLDYALANDERFGIWGGLSERERRRLRRARVA